MKKKSKRILLVNTFGTLGYLLCFLLWSWIGLLYLPMALENEHVERLIIPAQSEEIPAYTPSGEMHPLMVVVALGITAVVIIATIVVFLKAPATIANTGKAATTKVAHSALPIVTRHHKLPTEKKKLLTAQLVKLTKLILILAPTIIGLFLGAFIMAPLPSDIAIFVLSILALLAVVAFSAQYLLAQLLKIDASYLV